VAYLTGSVTMRVSGDWYAPVGDDMTKTVSRKAKYKVGQDARRANPKTPRAKTGKRIVMNHFPHSKAGRPKIVDDLVGSPI
jgi:hypothetical protein